MLERIFPRQIDNTYRGHWLGLAIFMLLVLARLAMGVGSVIDTRDVLTGPDGFPLERYGADAAAAVVAVFAILGWAQALFGLLGAVVLVRWRALIPFFYLIFLIELAGRRTLLFLNPIERSDAYQAMPMSFYINLALLLVLLIGFVLSLMNRPSPAGRRLAEGSN